MKLLDECKNYLDEAIKRNDTMVFVRLFRRKIKGVWEYYADTDIIRADGSGDSRRAVKTLVEPKKGGANDFI